MDAKLLEALAADGVAAFSMDSGLTEGDFGWGSGTFHKMVGLLLILDGSSAFQKPPRHLKGGCCCDLICFRTHCQPQSRF